MTEYPLDDQIGSIELIDFMGNDLSVVNDARTSYDRQSSKLDDKDIKLINYLIKHNHSSPLRGVVFKFRVKAPLYICRQWWKHVIASNHNDEQLGWNEKSFRYVKETEPEFYIPVQFRQQSQNNKQGSGKPVHGILNTQIQLDIRDVVENQYEIYTKLLKYNIAKEQARGVLPTCIYTTWVWTASLQSVLHFIDLRDHEGAQWEIQQYAQAIERFITPFIPETIKAWRNKNNE